MDGGKVVKNGFAKSIRPIGAHMALQIDGNVIGNTLEYQNAITGFTIFPSAVLIERFVVVCTQCVYRNMCAILD